MLLVCKVFKIFLACYIRPASRGRYNNNHRRHQPGSTLLPCTQNGNSSPEAVYIYRTDQPKLSLSLI